MLTVGPFQLARDRELHRGMSWTSRHRGRVLVPMREKRLVTQWRAFNLLTNSLQCTSRPPFLITMGHFRPRFVGSVLPSHGTNSFGFTHLF